MPLSKAKDRERKRVKKIKEVGIQPNEVVLHLNPAMYDWLKVRTKEKGYKSIDEYILNSLEKAASGVKQKEEIPRVGWGTR